MKKIVITYGLISGAISATLMVVGVTFFCGNSNNPNYDGSMVFGYASMILAFLLIYFGMASYRDNVAGGRVKYGKALAIGLLITAISCLCYAITWMIVYHTIMPDFMEKYSAHAIEKLNHSGESADKISAKIADIRKMQEWYKNPVLVFLMTLCEPLPVGIIVSLVSAFLVRLKKTPKTAI